MASFRRIRRLLTLVVVVLAALFLLGMLYERSAKARDARAFPPVGRMVDVGGRRLHLLCIGTGAPVVLFEASGFGNALSSSVARQALARDTTVCSYDRMGVGWSDAWPETVTVGTLVSDLEQLLGKAAIPTPVVVVTSSIGGLVTELFARQRPSRVAGAVFLDAATSDGVAQLGSIGTPREAGVACALVAAAGHSGVLRLLDPFDLRADQSSGGRSAALMHGAQPWNALCALVRGVAQTMQEFASAPPIAADLPLTVLSAESERGLAPPALARWFEPPVLARFEPLLASRVERHQKLASRSSRGQWRMVPGSTHLIATSRPDAVADALRELLAQVRVR
jgi:pimeloyl-ACP methyl ester carboxylesterase